MTQASASLPGRIGAFLAGIAIFVVGVVVSFGFVLLAPLGIWVTHRIQRARGRTTGLFDRWVGAVAGSTLAMLLVTVAVVAAIPADTWRDVRHTADSASVEAQKQPPPAWIRRIAPSANQSMSLPRQSIAVSTAAMVWGAGVGVVMFGAVAGSIGWAATMLLIFAVSGEWVRAPPVVDTGLTE